MAGLQTLSAPADHETTEPVVPAELAEAEVRPRRPRFKKSDERGGVLRPIYGERSPVMYHIFDSEMTSISSLNGEATRYFSFGSFFIGIIVAITVAYLFADKEVKGATYQLAHYSLPVLGVVTIICFGFGIWAAITKSSIITQIKKETRAATES